MRCQTTRDDNYKGGLSMLQNTIKRAGNMRWGLIALLLGLPLPIVLIAWLFAGR